MEDKAFELLEKMYADFTARFNKVDNRFDKVDNRFDKVDNRFDKVENRLDKIEVTLEHEIKTKLQALHEREADNADRLQEHSEQLADIKNKLDYMALSVNSQDKRLEIVESSRRKKAK